MSTFNLIQRFAVFGQACAIANWELPDLTLTKTVITKEDQIAIDTGSKQHTKPDSNAKLLLYSKDRVVFNTKDGLLSVGDFVELNGRLFIKTGSEEDFISSTLNASGGLEIANRGHAFVLEKEDYSGTLDKLTLIKDILGIKIVDNVLDIDEKIYTYTRTILPPPKIKNSIAFDLSTYKQDTSIATTISFSHTCTGSNDALFIGLKWDSTDATASGTYNGVSVTNKENTHGGPYVSALELLSPATGSNTLSLTGGLSFSRQCYAYSLTGVSSIGATGNSNGSGSPASLALSTSANDCLVDFLFAPNSFLPNAGGSQTNAVATEYTPNFWISASMQIASGGTTTNSWSNSAMGSWIQVGIVFTPSGGGGGFIGSPVPLLVASRGNV